MNLESDEKRSQVFARPVKDRHEMRNRGDFGWCSQSECRSSGERMEVVSAAFTNVVAQTPERWGNPEPQVD